MKTTLITTGAALLFLSSCTTMNKRECQDGAWEQAGYEDASNGLTSERLQKHAKACAKHGVAANEALYTEGYNDGLSSYCTAETGVRKGRVKADYRGICPADLELGFLTGYIQGLDIALDDLDREYSETREELRDVRYYRLRRIEDADLTRIDKRIAELQEELRDINQQRVNITATIARWTSRL